MRNEFTPYFRSTVGAYLNLSSIEPMKAWRAIPPYNIAKTGEDAYRVTLAVAGFGLDEIEIVVEDNFLNVSAESHGESAGEFLHRGIAKRAFARRFHLAEHVRVEGANLNNGLLSIDLAREVPEAKKPRRVKIEARSPALTAQAA
jgi:molecular chaperone IbpA